MTRTAADRVPPTWRLIGVLSGAAPGLVIGGSAALAGDLVGSSTGMAGPTIAVVLVAALGIVGAVAFALLPTASRKAQSNRSWFDGPAPAIIAATAVALMSAALLPDKIADLVAIGVGTILRLAIAFLAGIVRNTAQPT
jgi:hypothetical protein